MYGKGDPGYKSTSMFLIESAISLLQNSNNGDFGVLTPATGLGEDLVNRLKDQGVIFEGPINKQYIAKLAISLSIINFTRIGLFKIKHFTSLINCYEI